MVIKLTHKTATFTLLPEHAEPVRAVLAMIDKTKGRKGPKLARPKGDAKHDSSKRDYPKFNPACMLTSDYVTAYIALNHKRLHLAPLDIAPEINRTPPQIDPTIPEITEETLP
jgi:hypothetical protein